MNIRKVIISLLLLGNCAHVTAAEKKDTSEERLIPPQFVPVERETLTKCGRVDHLGLRFYVVKSTSLELLSGDAPQSALDGLEQCILKRHNNQLTPTYSEQPGPEFFHDEILCSRQKIPGFPETFTVTAIKWQYLHPARIHKCFELLKEYQRIFEERQRMNPSAVPA